MGNMKGEAVRTNFGTTFYAIAALVLAACSPSTNSEAEDAVRALMRDPDSTQFRNVSICPNDRNMSHGEYNAKNLYGAYVGFEPFYYSADTGAVFLADAEFSEMLGRCFKTDSDSPSIEEQADALEAEGMAALSDRQPEKDAEVAIDESSPNTISDCLGDYCPCDTSDPAYGGADEVLCRNIENGVPVDDEAMASGAALRDARQQLDDFEAEYGSFD